MPDKTTPDTEPHNTESPNTESHNEETTSTESLEDLGLGPAAGTTEPLEPGPASAPADAERMPRPRIRFGAMIWGLIVTISAAITLVVATDPAKSREFSSWIGNVSAESIGLIALIAVGALILLLGLVSLLRQAQRRGERS